MADEKFECECLKCGHKFTSETHCIDTKCPECGGKTRRAERPGAGKENRTEETDEIMMAKWTTKFINDLPNSSFAAIEPDYLSGKTEDKNARHLPYKDSSGKVDLPHLRNARARMNQIIPVTKSISTEALRAKAKKVLDAAAKRHLKPKTFDMGDELIHLSMERSSKIELVEDKEDAPTYKVKFELIDVNEYNKFDFSLQNLHFMVKEFVDDSIGVVSHGLDHSVRTLEQLGKVYDLKFDDTDGKAKVFAFSELYKETESQKDAYILFKQGLLKFVSGGWKPKKFLWNEEKNNISIVDPKLIEISSTPAPAKRDAKALEILNSLTQAPDLEESNMTESDQEIVEQPSQEGDEEIEQSAEQSTLTKKMEAELAKMTEMREKAEAEMDDKKKADLIERAKKLGLSEELFTDRTLEEMELALTAAKEIQVAELAKREPEFQLGGEDGAALQDGSPEMVIELEKKYYDWGDLGDEEVVF